MSSEKLKFECIPCKASGIYSGRCEPEGVGVICTRCKGEGYEELSADEVVSYNKPFVEKKIRGDIILVEFRMQYEEFVKLPQH
ncbi:MAG: hypothetical protein QG583_43 [Patescibacteria group bacterium]|nr:hypothetical protein [Patescibacteria group bacterium]